MMETEILQLTGFGSKAAEKNLPISLNTALRRGRGRILVACNAGRIRSELLKSLIPDELLANPDVTVGYNDLSVFTSEGPLVVPALDEHALILRQHPKFVLPFNRIVLANGNFNEQETADTLVVGPLLNKYQSRLSQIVTVDLRG